MAFSRCKVPDEAAMTNLSGSKFEMTDSSATPQLIPTPPDTGIADEIGDLHQVVHPIAGAMLHHRLDYRRLLVRRAHRHCRWRAPDAD